MNNNIFVLFQNALAYHQPKVFNLSRDFLSFYLYVYAMFLYGLHKIGLSKVTRCKQPRGNYFVREKSQPFNLYVSVYTLAGVDR